MKHRGNFGPIQKTLHSWWKRKIANPSSTIDDYVMHFFGNTIKKQIAGPTWRC